VVQLRDSYDETLDALRRRFEQLEAAVAQFPPDLDEQALSTAWYSGDPRERNRADRQQLDSTPRLIRRITAWVDAWPED